MLYLAIYFVAVGLHLVLAVWLCRIPVPQQRVANCFLASYMLPGLLTVGVVSSLFLLDQYRPLELTPSRLHLVLSSLGGYISWNLGIALLAALILSRRIMSPNNSSFAISTLGALFPLIPELLRIRPWLEIVHFFSSTPVNFADAKYALLAELYLSLGLAHILTVLASATTIVLFTLAEVRRQRRVEFNRVA